MRLAPQITLRNISPSDAIDSSIRKYIAKLDKFYDRIMGCRVLVEMPHRHHQGNLYHVRIDLTVPGGELVINRDPPTHQAREDFYVALQDAFDRAERQLKDYAQQQRHETQVHEVPSHGKIATLFPEEGYGFIETATGEEVYFHENSLINADFSQLETGQEVRFAEETGEEGAQASTVKIIGKHHLHG